MEARKRPVIRVLNALMTCLGVAAGGLAVCSALLLWQGGLAADVPAGPDGASEVEGVQSGERAENPEGSDPAALGLSLAAQGDWAAAVEPLEAALEADSGDPELYETLARAYRETDRDSDAAEVLRAGTAATGAEELELPLRAVEATLDMPEDQRASLEALYAAFQSGEEAALSAALQDWENGMEILNEAGDYEINPLWVKTGHLAWDGTRFWSGYSGTGLLFGGIDYFYGEITENVPNGAGSCVSVHTWYADSSAMDYLRLDGQWENGVAVGEVTFHQRCTNAADANVEYDISAALDGTAEELFTTAEVTLRTKFTPEEHQFHFSIRDGYLSRDDFQGAYGYYSIRCSAHANCRVELAAREDDFLLRCQNPYPWDRESPYEDPWEFMNFSYSQPAY